MHSSKHIPFFSGTNISCARCFDKVPASGPCTRSWLQGLCQKMYTPEDRPVPLHYNHVQLAHHTAHVSHNLYYFRGIFFCNKCGHYGVNRFIKLIHPCDKPKHLSHGHKSLSALRNGRLPPGLTIWPKEWEQDALENLYQEMDHIQSMEPQSPESISFPSSDCDSQAQIEDTPSRVDEADMSSISSD